MDWLNWSIGWLYWLIVLVDCINWSMDLIDDWKIFCTQARKLENNLKQTAHHYLSLCYNITFTSLLKIVISMKIIYNLFLVTYSPYVQSFVILSSYGSVKFITFYIWPNVFYICIIIHTCTRWTSNCAPLLKKIVINNTTCR